MLASINFFASTIIIYIIGVLFYLFCLGFSAAPDARKLQVYQKFLDQQWLAGEGNPCDLIRAKYIQVAMTMTSDIGGEDLLSNYSMILSSAGALEEKSAPLGSGLLEKQMKVLFLKCSTSGHKSLQKVNHCLQSGNHEIRSTCIEYLQSTVEEQAQTVDFWQDVQVNHKHILTLMLLVADLTSTKWCKKPE